MLSVNANLIYNKIEGLCRLGRSQNAVRGTNALLWLRQPCGRED